MKFVREFEQAYEEVVGVRNNQKIDYLQMNEILRRMHFLKINKEENNSNNFASERKLVYNIWHNLRGDELNGVTKCNLC